jgi:mannose-6-phosphate isomerase-like protein (cupin superfamily)
MDQPLIIPPQADSNQRLEADGQTICIHEWRGSGPALLHVHHEDDEAWHVLEGQLQFRFRDHSQAAPAGSTAFVPAGVPHTYEALPGARYLIILTPRLRSLIAELQAYPRAEHPLIYQRHASQLLE